MRSVEQVHRAREIEDFTNLHFVHRISGWLTPLLARHGVHPNAVSFTGMTFGVVAGVAYYHYHNIYGVIGGFALMIAWHVLDGVDGQLARLTNTQSDFGKVIDGICDNITFIAVYIGLGLALAKEGEAFAWSIILLAGALQSIQAAAYEAQRQEFVRAKEQDYALDFAIYCVSGKLDGETDGDTWHANPERAASDILRDNALETVGWKVLRFNTQKIREEITEYTVPIVLENINRLDGIDEGQLLARRFDLDSNDNFRQPGLFDQVE